MVVFTLVLTGEEVDRQDQAHVHGQRLRGVRHRGRAGDHVKDLGEERVYSLFYPERNVLESVFEEPDWSYVHAEMAKVGVNLRLLHDEYKARCARERKAAMGYTRFCERCGDYTVANNLTRRMGGQEIRLFIQYSTYGTFQGSF